MHLVHQMMKPIRLLVFHLVLIFLFSTEVFMVLKFFHVFTHQMCIFLKDLRRFYIDLLSLKSDSKPHMQQFNQRVHDLAQKDNMTLALEKASFILLTVKDFGQEIGFETTKPIQSTIASIQKLPSLATQKELTWLIGSRNFYFLLINLMFPWSVCMI